MRQAQEEKFIKSMVILEKIDGLQRDALQHYEEGMTCLSYAKFQSDSLCLQLNSNAMEVTPAQYKIENFALVETDKSAFSLTPIYSDKLSWTELTPQEYEQETETILSQTMDADQCLINQAQQNSVIIKVREEFTQALNNYLKLAEIMQSLK